MARVWPCAEAGERLGWKNVRVTFFAILRAPVKGAPAQKRTVKPCLDQALRLAVSRFLEIAQHSFPSTIAARQMHRPQAICP
ncbi:hypothetical protein LZ24_01950 [Desulfobotulus alkaliphilus]|uniref:Uncharacterized protein n=1 Tax=Desulfobotulus alkaliphilus TaxID=622671 RepID=A0A562RRF0_9BACT|nr:hypothetical protein LZ24_01950 [Desulfobotulus alkaliphilus]